ncbi:MAG: FliH/SctL family protein [Telluria sp.]
MATIIRSAVVSEEKRKLPARGAGKAMAASAAAAAPAAPAPAAPAAPPNVEQLIEQARTAVLAQFKNEADTARELGRERGLQEGRQQGAAEARQSFEAELARVRSLADGLQAALAGSIHGLEDLAVALAFEAVCKMLGTAAVTEDGIRALVHQAAQHAAHVEKVVVRLHPADLAALTDAGALDGALPSGSAASWVADKSIELGGCVVETDGGKLDARLETQIEGLREALVAARRRAG